jgi:outer membrane protein assembly factor BamB
VFSNRYSDRRVDRNTVRFGLVATLKGEVLRIDPENGKISETYAIGAPIRSQPAIDRGRLYVGTDDGQIVCVDTGNVAFTNWSTWGGNAAHTGVAKK